MLIINVSCNRYNSKHTNSTSPVAEQNIELGNASPSSKPTPPQARAQEQQPCPKDVAESAHSQPKNDFTVNNAYGFVISNDTTTSEDEDVFATDIKKFDLDVTNDTARVKANGDFDTENLDEEAGYVTSVY